jgi:hypothetical protein
MSYNRNAQGYAEGSGAHPSKTAKRGAADSGVVQRLGQPPADSVVMQRWASPLQPLRNASGRHSTHWPIEGPSGAFDPSMNFATTERIANITIKSAESMTAINRAGTHLVVQGTNKINGM